MKLWKSCYVSSAAHVIFRLVASPVRFAPLPAAIYFGERDQGHCKYSRADVAGYGEGDVRAVDVCLWCIYILRMACLNAAQKRDCNI